jgi:hypothetical protein
MTGHPARRLGGQWYGRGPGQISCRPDHYVCESIDIPTHDCRMLSLTHILTTELSVHDNRVLQRPLTACNKNRRTDTGRAPV